MFPQHLGDYVENKLAITPESLAGDGSSNTEDIDRQDFYSGVLAIATDTTLDAGSGTVDLVVTVQDAAEAGGSYADYDSATFELTHNEAEINELDLDLKGADRYLKVIVEPDGVAADAIITAGTLALGGSVKKPV